MSSNSNTARKHRLLKRTAVRLGLLSAIAALVLSYSYLWKPLELPRYRIVMRDGLAYDGQGRRPFTGLVFEKFPGGARQTAIEMRNGKVNGWSRGWFENGKVEVEEYFVDGVSQGTRRRWFDNGQRRSEAQIDHGKLSGLFVEWYDNGQKAVEMTMVDGKPDGVAQSWHRTGALKSRTTLKVGDILEQQFFPERVAQNEASATQP